MHKNPMSLHFIDGKILLLTIIPIALLVVFKSSHARIRHKMLKELFNICKIYFTGAI
jgi:hypothetical protein